MEKQTHCTVRFNNIPASYLQLNIESMYHIQYILCTVLCNMNSMKVQYFKQMLLYVDFKGKGAHHLIN